MVVMVLRWLLLACAARAGAGELFDRELLRAARVSALCARQLATARRTDFFDASFRAPSGLLDGNLADFGNYHQCLAIDQPFPGGNAQGKYCLLRAPLAPPTVRIPSLAGASAAGNVTWTEVTLPEGLEQQFAGRALSLGVCVPKACAVEAVLAPYAEHPGVRFNYTEQFCRLPGDKPFVAGDYVAIAVFSLLGILTLISTSYELRHIFILKRDPARASALLRACSLYRNTRRLLTFDQPRALDCLDGIRSLSTLMIMAYHSYVINFSPLRYVINSFERDEWEMDIQALWITSADIAVDSFLTMSGLLLVYTSCNKLAKTSLLRSIPLLLLSRYLRLFPLLATAVLLQAFLLHQSADGPGWQAMAKYVGRCRRYWWSALLHVQNFVNVMEICVPPAWYLSIDSQLYLLAPLALSGALRGRRAACALAAALLASLAAALAITVIYPSPISLRARGVSIRNEGNYTPLYYKNVVVRSPPFFLGMLFGYFIHIKRGQRVSLPQWVKVTCHSLSLATFAYVVYIVHPSVQPGWDHQLVDSMHNALRRPAWSLALCWLIFACIHGYGGPVNWFLSLRLWKFVARISYAMYLLHFALMLIGTSAASAPVYFSPGRLFFTFAWSVAYTVPVAIAACVLIEEPAFTLQRMLFRDFFKPVMKTEEGKTASVIEEGNGNDAGVEDDKRKNTEKSSI